MVAESNAVNLTDGLDGLAADVRPFEGMSAQIQLRADMFIETYGRALTIRPIGVQA